MQRFENKVAFLTGAASGMGRAIAARLTDEGATVVGVDVNAEGLDGTAELCSGSGGAFSGHVLDITDVAAVTKLIDDVAASHGRLDVVGNIAGIHPKIAPIAQVTEEVWDRYMAVNAKAVFFVARAALPHLVAAEGAMVNIASNAGLMGMAYNLPYCASKGAVVQITRSLALEYVKAPVRINAIAPGGVQTALVENIEFGDDIDFDLVMRYTSPRGMDTVESIAALFAYLASDEATNMHGAIVTADSGLTAG